MCGCIELFGAGRASVLAFGLGLPMLTAAEFAGALLTVRSEKVRL